MDIEIPEWFDKSLIPLLKHKLDRSQISNGDRVLDWAMRQMLRAIPTSITGVETKYHTWTDIEHLIETACGNVKEKPDIVIGIKSGGALIANYVAKCLNVLDVDYMHIAHYSDNARSVVKSVITSMGKEAVIKEEPTLEIPGKGILLVDDQRATGSTFDAGAAYMLEKGAKDVRTFCLYSLDMKSDYCAKKGQMMYTPWGKDA